MANGESVRAAYDGFAPVYDDFTSANNYEMWLGELLLPCLHGHGLRLGTALDVGCGTGRAFDPLLDRGWKVVGCDISRGMLKQAAVKFGSRVELVAADARDLSPIASTRESSTGSEGFQLILLLNPHLLTLGGTEIERPLPNSERGTAPRYFVNEISPRKS
jgi:SAM-dependent methyltransferase